MIDPAQQQLLASAQSLVGASANARAWVTRLAPTAASLATDEASLVKVSRQAENLARKLAGSAQRRNSVGVFGPSQAGKSYLVSVLARNQESRNPLMADFAGQRKNFITEINPPGDRESTGLVTRFTIVPGTTDEAHPVELRMLTETDLVKILGNSFLSDFDPSNRRIPLPGEDEIGQAIAAAEAMAGAAAGHLDEIAMFDLGEYFETYFPTPVEPFTRARFWDALARFGHRLPLSGRVKLYALLWGNLEDFTRLFLTLVDALAKLQHPPLARVTLLALDPSKSIIDVQVLMERLNTAEDASDLISVLPEFQNGKTGTPAKISRAVLTALVAELKIVVAEKPWDFFEFTDLLDFPGARSRKKQVDLPSDPADRDKLVRNLLLRGKIAYLFQRYTEERELTCMLLCMPPSVAEVQDLSGMVRGWVDQTHGSTPEQRRRLSRALFLVLTKFDMDFIEKDGDTNDTRREKFTRRLGASFLDLYGRDQWVQDWDGKPFDDVLFLRNPGLKQPHLVRYGEVRRLADGSEQRAEAAIADEALPRLAEFKAGFLQSPVCRKHIREPEAVWDAAFELNDGGVSYLVNRLQAVLTPTLKTRQLVGRLVDQARQLKGRLERHYQAGDAASRKEADEALLALRARLVAACAPPRGFRNFIQLLSRMKLSELEVRSAFLQTAATLKVEAAPATAAAADAVPDAALWDELWSDAPATTPTARQAPARQRDRSDNFAAQVLSIWSGRVRGLSAQPHLLSALGLDQRLVGDLAEVLVVGAHRLGLAASIADRARAQLASANVRWDEVADRGAGLAAMMINDYVAYLGFTDLPCSERAAVPEAPRPRVRGVFEAVPVPQPGKIPELGAKRTELEKEYFREWLVALRQLGLDNVSFSGGREIGEEDNAALGRILSDMEPALKLSV